MKALLHPPMRGPAPAAPRRAGENFGARAGQREQERSIRLARLLAESSADERTTASAAVLARTILRRGCRCRPLTR